MDNNQETHRNKKDAFELKQQEKQKLQEAKNRKRILKKVFVWILSIAVAGLLVYGVIFYANQAEKNNPGEQFNILGREHIQNGATHSQYNSNPPTSGWHYSQPANFGVYKQELPDENILHNLEHGGIWISYKPDIDEDIKSKLEDIGKNNSGSVVVSPRAANDSNIAVASWGRLLKLDNIDENQIKLFIKMNKNRSPEPLAK